MVGSLEPLSCSEYGPAFSKFGPADGPMVRSMIFVLAFECWMSAFEAQLLGGIPIEVQRHVVVPGLALVVARRTVVAAVVERAAGQLVAVEYVSSVPLRPPPGRFHTAFSSCSKVASE